MKNFSDLLLIDSIIKNILDAGYSTPTDIQVEAIPALIQGRDVLGIAQTGTGKTAAFSLPIIQKLVASRETRKVGSPKALILVPTRELCSQISQSISVYAKDLDIKSTAIFGGVSQKDQENALKAGVDIVVATPGRLLDLMNQRIVVISRIDFFVLDEADRMLDMGFMEDIQKIIAELPSQRQTMLFSATMPPIIAKLSQGLLKNALKVQVSPPSSTVDKIEQKIIMCRDEHKFQLLKKILKERTGLALVFTTSKTKADEVVEYLLQNRIATGAIHADKKQSERERHLNNFRNKVIKVLVATDIASRGIDVEGVSHVINFDLPLTPETYVHRIGRTGRAGSKGVAISFCDESELHLLEKIKRTLKEEFVTENFVGKKETMNLQLLIERRKKAPTPGKSQEKTAWLDHSKRQSSPDAGEKKRLNPAFKKNKKR